MGIIIEKLQNGTVSVNYGGDMHPMLLNQLRNIKISNDDETITVNFSASSSLRLLYSAIDSINGEDKPGTINECSELLASSVFNFGGGSGGDGAVESVTGNLVTGTSANPTINFPIGNNREVPLYLNNKVVKGRLGWAQFSDLPTPPPFSNGVLTGTAFNETGNALFAFLELALGATNESIAKPNAIPFYNPGIIGTGGGTLPVADAIENGDAVNKGQFTSLLKALQGYNASGDQMLVQVGGVLQWTTWVR